MNNITIKEVKDILKCSIDETTNMNEAIERTLQHIYLKGYNDAKNLQVNEILKKIKKEMKGLLEVEQQIYGKNNWHFVNKCIDIIDKYKTESEGDKE